MTDQYQKEYDEAMKKLEAGETITPEVVKDEIEKPAKSDEIEELKLKFERQEKALKDTQRWGHENAARVANLERERDAQLKNANRPEILDNNPGLEEAIRHVVPAQAVRNEPDLPYILDNAVPGLNQMLDDKDFQDKFLKARDDSNGGWSDPLVAIRDVTNLVMQNTREQAIASAQKDFSSKQKKLDAMFVPGGSGSSDAPAKEVDAAQSVWDMSNADFDKMRRKAMGY